MAPQLTRPHQIPKKSFRSKCKKYEVVTDTAAVPRCHLLFVRYSRTDVFYFWKMAASHTVFALNSTFSSYEEFQKHLESYEQNNYVKLYRRRSRTIESALKRTPKRRFNSWLKFAELELCCIHGGKDFASRSIGKRPNQT